MENSKKVEEPNYELDMPKLPSELITDILLRLPVKSLCRFRCVSKLWRSLISDHHFVKLHFDRGHGKRLVLASCSLYSVDYEPPFDNNVVAEELDFPLKEIRRRTNNFIEIFGACNGLICIIPKPERFFIFNPCTGDSKEIPFISVPRSSDPIPNPVKIYGFGYAPFVDDYKFIRVFYGCITFVFSLRMNLWRRVHQNFTYELSSSMAPGAYVSGAVHWVARHHEGPTIIVAFDLSDEAFRELPVPVPVNSSNLLSLGVLRGCLCLLHDSAAQHEFWIMKEYGMKNSWSRILIAEPYTFLKPLCFWKNTKILLEKDLNQLVLCHPKDGTCKEFVVEGMPLEFYAEFYVESLVSPNFVNET